MMKLKDFAALLIKCADKYPDMDVQVAKIHASNNEGARVSWVLSYRETYSKYTKLSVSKSAYTHVDDIPLGV